MAIRYVDYTAVNGDISGDGSSTNPYRTITKAVSVSANGDEIRVAKTANPMTAPVTLEVIYEENIMYVRGQDVRATYPENTAIGNPTDGWKRVQYQTLEGSDTILLGPWSNPWADPTKTSITAYKPNPTPVPAVGTQDTYVENLSTSYNTTITISGGWNLSGTPTKDGETWLCPDADGHWTGSWLKVVNGNYHISDFVLCDFYIAIYDPYGRVLSYNNIKFINCSVALQSTFSFHEVNNVVMDCCDYGLIANDVVYGTLDGLTVRNTIGRSVDMNRCKYCTFKNLSFKSCVGTILNINNCSLNNFYDVTLHDATFSFNDIIVVNWGNGNKFYRLKLTWGEWSTFMYWLGYMLVLNNHAGAYFEDCEINYEPLGSGGVYINASSVEFHRLKSNFDPSWFSVGAGDGNEARFWKFNDIDDFHFLATGSGLIEATTAQSINGIAWKMTNNSISVNPDHPVKLKVAEIASPAGKTTTITVNVYIESSSGTPPKARLFCRGGQLTGIPAAGVSSAWISSPLNQWTPLSISVTPTEAGVYEVEVQMYYDGGSSAKSIYVDQVTLS